MKIFKRLILTAVIFCLLLVPLTITVSAADQIAPDNINSIMSYFGIDTSDPESIQNAIAEIENGGLSGIMNFLGINVADILNELENYLNLAAATTVATETTSSIAETTTEEATKTEITTETVASAPVSTTATPPHTQASVAKPLPTKPAISVPSEITETTEEPATEPEVSSEQESSEEKTTEEGKYVVISGNTLIVIFVTLVIFLAGLSTGILVSRRISERQRKRDE